MDLEKTCHRVPRKVMWWAMRVMDIAEWIITLAKATYYNVKSRDKVDCVCNNMFSVDIVLQILVFMEAFS